MKSAGRIALAAAAATSLVSGSAAAMTAVHSDTAQVADSTVDPHAQQKAALSRTLDRLDAKATALQLQLKHADKGLSTAERALLAARADAARRAAAAAAAAVNQQPTSTQPTPTSSPTVKQSQPAPVPQTTTGASGATATGDDGSEVEGND